MNLNILRTLLIVVLFNYFICPSSVQGQGILDKLINLNEQRRSSTTNSHRNERDNRTRQNSQRSNRRDNRNSNSENRKVVEFKRGGSVQNNTKANKSVSKEEVAISSTESKSGLQKDNNTITLIVSGDGYTREEATKNALRSAIEQAFGTFVSSNTDVINDELVRDEIVTVSSGNIQSYKELSNTLYNGICSVSLQACVSIGQLVQYAQNKGMSTELSGATFVMNKRMRELNEKNEKIAFDNMIIQLKKMSINLFDYELTADSPKEINNLNQVPLSIIVKSNSNTVAFFSVIMSTLNNLAMSKDDQNEYDQAGRKYVKGYVTHDTYCFRTCHWRGDYEIKVRNIFLNAALLNFKVSDNLGNEVRIFANHKNYDNEFYKSNDSYLLLGPVVSEFSKCYDTLRQSFFSNLINCKPDQIVVSIKANISYSDADIEKLSSIEICPNIMDPFDWQKKYSLDGDNPQEAILDEIIDEDILY